MNDGRHDWNAGVSISQDMMPPILSTQFVCSKCGAEAWVTSQEGRETRDTRDSNGLVACHKVPQTTTPATRRP